MSWNFLLHGLLMLHLRGLETAPSVTKINWVRVNDFVLRLDDTCWSRLIFLLLLWCLIDLAIVKLWLSLGKFSLSFLLFLLLSHLLLLDSFDLFLLLSLRLIEVNISQKRIICLNLYCHKRWLSALAIHVLHDFVISRDLLLVLSQYSPNTINGCVRHKLFEIGVNQELNNISWKNNVIQRA